MQAGPLRQEWLPLLFCCCLFGAAPAGAIEPRAAVEARIDPVVDDLRALALAGDFSNLRFRIISSDLVKAAGVWDENATLIFPPTGGVAHVSDGELLNDRERWLALLREASPSAWERRDVSGEVLHYCRKGEVAVCLAINAAALATELDLSAGELAAAVDAPVGRSWGWIVIASALLLALPITWRIRRRQEPASPEREADTIRLGDVVIAPRKLAGRRGRLTFDLTRRDVKLLAHLAAHPGDVVTKDELYDVGWGRGFLPNSRALEQHMMTLRRKLDPDKTRATVIETVHGHGYRFPGGG